jgi:hypothetical protein
MSIDYVTEQPLDLYQRGQAADAHWVVKRETSEPKSRHQSHTNHVKEKLRAREWGGEVALKTYCTAAAAQILLKHLGRDLSAFLAVADHADLRQVIEYLHASASDEAATATAAQAAGKPLDEPPLPL